jgi:hypothetical protein
MQNSAGRERVSTKVLIEYNGYSIVDISNAGGKPLSFCSKGNKLEKRSALQEVPY